jgi:hypothetical protein
MAEELSTERARAQAWEMMLAKAREVQGGDPGAAAAAKTLLGDPAWKEVIEAGVTAAPATGGSGEAVAWAPEQQGENQARSTSGGLPQQEPTSPAGTGEAALSEDLVIRYLNGEDVLTPDMIEDLKAAIESGNFIIEESLGL